MAGELPLVTDSLPPQTNECRDGRGGERERESETERERKKQREMHEMLLLQSTQSKKQ